MTTLENRVAALELAVELLKTQQTPSNGNGPDFSHMKGKIADDSDLDSEWGDPEVYKDPPRWTGESFAGQPLSKCSPEFLEVYASFKEWQGDRDNEDGNQKNGRYTATYRYIDAARARGWAKRLRASNGSNRNATSRTAKRASTSEDTPF
jgi:hypothetical protein